MAEHIIEHSSLKMYEEDQSKYSIIVNRRRAIAEVRDGLQPVQRRILYAAYKDGLLKPSQKVKSAKLVGDTMGNFHAHGDGCLAYDTIIWKLDGTYTTIGELYDSGVESINTLGVDQNGNIVPVVANHFRIGKYTNKEYHIRLSNGYVIKATDNHPFLLADLTWSRADQLKPYTRLFTDRILPHNGTNRPDIQRKSLAAIVSDYYSGPAPEGYERHHKDRNYFNNDPSNIEVISKYDHMMEHCHDQSTLDALSSSRYEMFDENGKYRYKTIRKNSMLLKSYNNDGNLRKFKSTIKRMNNLGIEITYENYESFRCGLNEWQSISDEEKMYKTYNLPTIEDLASRYGEETGCYTFEDFVNFDLPSVGDLYNDFMSKVVSPINFIENEHEIVKPISFFYTERTMIYTVFERLIDLGKELTVENYFELVHDGSEVNPEKIKYLIGLFRVEKPYIESINVINVDNKPMYDFTVDGVNNMLIPVVSEANIQANEIFGYNIPFICAHNSIYSAIITMVSWFKSKIPLMYGKGNWGNVMGAGAAAQRYTECSLSNFGYDVMIDELAQSKNIVDWIDTYTREDKEPEYLPAKLPMLLINGAFGIGVGMSINVPAHNISEVIAVTRALLKNPNSPVVLIPDLCQSCEIIEADWKEICDTGRGSFKVRGKVLTEQDKKGNYLLRIVSLPDGVNSTSVYEKILSLIEAKQLPMIKDIFNSLENENPNLIIHLKPGADPEYVKQALYAKTGVQSTISVNFEAVSMNGIDIKRFSYKEYLLDFIDMRMTTKFRLYCNLLQQHMTRHHHIDAFVKVLESGEIDKIIDMIRKQKTVDNNELIEFLIKKTGVTDLQAKFIITTQLSQLSMGHLNKYKAERDELNKKIADITKKVTDDGSIIRSEIDAELVELDKKYGSPRICNVISATSETEIPAGTFKVVITERNYIRKVPDVDKVGIVRKDNPKFILQVDNRESILIFDNKGKVFNLPVHKIPITDRSGAGTDVRILVKNLTSDIIAVFYEPIFDKVIKSGLKHYLTVLTKLNSIKKLDIEDFTNVSPSGLMYSKVSPEDEVVDVVLAPQSLDCIISSGHKALRTSMKNIPLYKRNAAGAKAMDTTENLTGLSVIYPDVKDVVVLTKNGKFNKFNIEMLTPHSRGKKGSGVIKIEGNDEIFGIYGVNDGNKLRIVTSEGIVEVPVDSIKTKSTLAAGVRDTNVKGIIVKADVIV